MNIHFHRRVWRHQRAAAALTMLMLASASGLAAPGAHGPNGEHLDAPSALRASSTLPRLEAHTEGFELVAELRAGELVIVVDRYESNEPVLGARLDVESGPLKATATFRADQGDYVVTDAALLGALAAPGEHGLVFTLVAGADSDLLDGTLVIASDGAAAAAARGDHGHGGDDHGHDDEPRRAAWIATGATTVGLIGGVAWWRQRRRDAGKLQEGL